MRTHKRCAQEVVFKVFVYQVRNKQCCRSTLPLNAMSSLLDAKPEHLTKDLMLLRAK